MSTLTICLTTSRREPQFEWLLDSIANQANAPQGIEIIIVDLWKDERAGLCVVNGHLRNAMIDYPYKITCVKPKPNVWQGKYRKAQSHYWAVCNARNTALCMAQTEWILFLDDRSVLMPGFFDAVKDAMAGRYIMAGAYEKRTGMTVENGFIKNGGTVIGTDVREPHGRRPCVGNWLFGCCVLAPVEWLLHVNGYPEILCDGMGFEDVILGIILQNNHYQIWYDPRAKMIEDRTPDQLGEAMKRTCKERHPNDKEDKAHKALARVVNMRRSENPFGEIRDLRSGIQRGMGFPILNLPQKDWFDGQPITEFT